MSMKPTKVKSGWVCLTVLFLLPAFARAEEQPVPEKLPQPVLRDKEAAKPDVPVPDAFNQILQTGCSSCNNGLFAPNVPSYNNGGCTGDSCEAGCFPGQKKCVPCEGHSCVSRMFCAFHDCLCCPDPCYEPRWVAAANAAFFVDAARPVTQMKFRWDYGQNVTQVDRAEYMWARVGGKGPPLREISFGYSQLNIYNEAAVDRFSMFTEMPYASIDPEINGGAGGFGDLKIGTKSLLLDCELIQTSFQFVTTVPTGNFRKGLGVGHVALEPSVLAAIKLYQDTYMQLQFSQWIPIGGTANFQGSIFHYHAALNHVICRPVGDTQLIGTMEFNGYSFQSGSYTDPILGGQPANNYTYMSVGPGLRYVICDKVDVGVGAAFAITGQHFAEQLYRTEFRWRF